MQITNLELGIWNLEGDENNLESGIRNLELILKMFNV